MNSQTVQARLPPGPGLIASCEAYGRNPAVYFQKLFAAMGSGKL